MRCLRRGVRWLADIDPLVYAVAAVGAGFLIMGWLFYCMATV